MSLKANKQANKHAMIPDHIGSWQGDAEKSWLILKTDIYTSEASGKYQVLNRFLNISCFLKIPP